MNFWVRFSLAILALVGVGFLFTFERPAEGAVQRGYRGIGMEQVYNRLRVENAVAANAIPEAVPETEKAGQRSSEVYQNVQVLGDVDANEFIRIMTAITAWVSPEQGCAYCHNLENMADESLYTYKVARRMIQMTRHTNADWKSHVGETGVTCWTCHRGQPVPNNIWFSEPTRGQTDGLVGNPGGQNSPSTLAGLASLPYDPFTPFLTKDEANIRVVSREPLPNTNRSSIKQTEWTYALMMHMSTSLGVNCTYCHNSRQFSDWSESSPARVSAWHGIQMTRDLNVNYLEPLGPVYPANRLGPTGDAPKVNCATCHQGAYKPLLGVSMVPQHPELGVLQVAWPAPPPAPTAPAALPPAPAQPTPAAPPSPAAPAAVPPAETAPVVPPAPATPATTPPAVVPPAPPTTPPAAAPAPPADVTPPTGPSPAGTPPPPTQPQ